MAKIRISAKDKKEYNKLKNNVKSKISRTLKNYGVNLENEVSIPSLSEFSSRKEFNAWKQKASSFTNRNNTRYQFRKNEKGMVYTIAELNEAKKANRIERTIAKKKQKEYANKPFMRHGQQIGTTGERFGMLKRPKNIGFSVPPEFDINNYYTRYDFQKRKEAMQRKATPGEFDRRLEMFKERYLIGLEANFNSDATNEILDKFRSLPADVLYDMYLENDELQNLFDPSPRESYEGIQIIDHGESLRMLHDAEKVIDRYLEGDDGLLRNFPIN